MINVTRLVRTCEACPAQWEGKTDDGRPVYVRYRWGFLKVYVGSPRETVLETIRNHHPFFYKKLGDPLDGFMEFDELRNATKHIVCWPDDYDDTVRSTHYEFEL